MRRKLPVRSDSPSIDASARASFVGRSRELAELRLGLRDAAKGSGAVVLISGEPGIGKTRLAEELSAEAAEIGFGVSWGRCWQGAGRPAYWPFEQALGAVLRAKRSSAARRISREIAHLMPGLAAARKERARAKPAHGADPEQVRLGLFDSVVRILAAVSKSTPQLIVFDDLQDAEHASWLMLRHAARALGNARVMFVAAYREAEVRSDPALAAVIADLLRGGRHIGLGGLSRSEVAEFVETAAGHAAGRALVEQLHSASGGNPFFVTEIVRTLVQRGAFAEGGAQALEIPDSVRAAIRGRVLAVAGAPVQVLSAAAVLGDLFDLETLARATGRGIEALLEVIDPAAAAGLVERAPGCTDSWRFSHSLIREALYDDLGAAERMRLHRRCLAVLEDLYAAEPERHLDQLAYHAVAAAALGDAEKAIGYATRAGDAAYAAAAYERAATHYRAGLALVERGGSRPARTATMLERLGGALVITEFEHPRGVECLERAAELYETARRPIEGARVRAQLALMLSRRSPALDIGRAMEQYQRAERVLAAQSDSPSQVWLYCGFSYAAMQAHRIAQGLAAAERAAEIAGRLGDQHLWLQAAVRRADHLFLSGRFGESIAVAEDAWRRADCAGDLEGAFDSTWTGGYFHIALWDPRGARRWFQRAMARPRIAAAPYYRQILTQQTAFSCVFTGELARARTLLERAPRSLVAAFLFLYEGEWERAEEILDEGREAMRAAGSRDLELVHSYFESLVLRTRGRLSREREVLGCAIEMSEEEGALVFELHLRVEAAMMAIASARFDDAIEQAAKIRARLPVGEELYGLGGRTSLALGLAADAQGRAAEAASAFASAMASFRRWGLPWEQAQGHRMRAMVLLGRETASAAASHLNAAAEIYRRHGAGARFIEQIESELARLAPSARNGGALPRLLRNGDSPADTGTQAAINGASSGKWEGSWSSEGEYWSIVYRDSPIRIRDTKGLRYIALLLARPGVPVSVLEMVRSKAPRLDRARVTPRERARIAVTKNIRAAVAKIRAIEPELGRHLATAIRTGYTCVYNPGARARWIVSGAGLPMHSGSDDISGISAGSQRMRGLP